VRRQRGPGGRVVRHVVAQHAPPGRLVGGQGHGRHEQRERRRHHPDQHHCPPREPPHSVSCPEHGPVCLRAHRAHVSARSMLKPGGLPLSRLVLTPPRAAAPRSSPVPAARTGPSR
jgi:hypothetical protein